MKQSVIDRSGGGALEGDLAVAFQNHCAKCHGSCGQCHVSVPSSAGGGLLKGHQFRRTPPMNNACVACHGSRVGAEYKGQNAGVLADVHYNRGMQCTGCHEAAEMHGQGQDGVTHRSKVPVGPACVDCHPDDVDFNNVMAHTLHRRDDDSMKLACQTCHSAQLKNCFGCHVRLEEGSPVYEVNAETNHESVMTFKIGRNPQPDGVKPDWVVLRHVPIAPTNYEFYGANLLNTFDARPTWVPATPHNIQGTARGCTDCHGAEARAIFLAPADLQPGTEAANASVVVETLPEQQ